MRLHAKKASKQDESRKKRNELADLILNIREQTTSLEIKEKLLGLERLLMDLKVNSCGTGTYGAELKQLLLEFPSVLNKGISQITDNYLNRIRDRITRWQQQSGMKEEPKMPFTLFGRKKAKENSLAGQKEKTGRNIFVLDQKNTELAMEMEKLEKEKQDLMLKAAKCAPGSQQYLLIKQNYNEKDRKLGAVSAHKAIVQKTLDSNREYLRTIETNDEIETIKILMPPSPEEIELAVQQNIAAQSSIFDDMEKAQAIMKYGYTQLQEINRESAGNPLGDPFDTAVNEIREADHGYQAILGPEASLVDEMRKPLDKNAPDQMESIEEGKP